MAWRNAQTLHINVPPAPPYGDNWVEQLLGAIVKPILDEFDEDILWMWVTRYAGPYAIERPPLGYELPEPYRVGGRYRFIAFRLSTTNESRNKIHAVALRLAEQAGFMGGYCDR